MKTFLLLVQIFSALALIVAVLLHSAKGEGLGGIGGAAKMFGSPKGLEEGLDKLTWTLAITFLSVSLLLAIIK